MKKSSFRNVKAECSIILVIIHSHHFRPSNPPYQLLVILIIDICIILAMKATLVQCVGTNNHVNA